MEDRTTGDWRRDAQEDSYNRSPPPRDDRYPSSSYQHRDRDQYDRRG